MKKIEKSIELGGKKLTLSTGHVAQQASGAVMATYGETVVLATAVAQDFDRDIDYFPLSVEYQEKLYAGGRIKGSRWVKREGRPTDDEILTARLIDRSVRPLFLKGYSKEVQIITTVLSVDLENPPDMVAAIAASAAISISEIPWNGPVAVLRVGQKDSELIVNPAQKEIDASSMDLVVSSTKDAVVMIEAGADQVTEEQIYKGIDFAQKEAGKVLGLIDDLAKEAGKKKEAFAKEVLNKGIYAKVKKAAVSEIKKLITDLSTKKAGYSDIDNLKKSVLGDLEEGERQEGSEIFEDIFHAEVRNSILSGKRADGRKTDELRELESEVGVLPRTHGSGLFRRGQTQALSIATLGAPSLEQFIETPSGEETKRYIHHYGMPPYSTGEAKKVGSPSRREIGHGALAEKALLPVIPSQEEFPYTIQVVTEILSSNGSTSMASTCGSTLSLMDAGVPIKAPIAGIAMGLIIENDKKYQILTDIVGLEDGYGDMDFKVAGSKEGITALQLDVKTLNLTSKILKEAMEQAKRARLEILEVMQKAIGSPRDEVSLHAPKIKIVKIKKEKIGELIGPGGRNIREIIAETQAQIDVDDDGSVFITGMTKEQLDAGVARVEAVTKDPQPGEIYKGTVKRIQPFGAFVEILPGREGLVHVSDISEDYVKDPSDVLSVDQEVDVRIKEIDDMNRLNLSMILDPAKDNKDERRDRRRPQGRDSRRRTDGRNNYQRRSSQGRSSGPHFPMSRFLDERKNKPR